MNTNDLIFKDEAFAIVGAAMEVHNQLGRGFLEAVYGDALAEEFRARGIPFEREVDITISYKGKQLPHRYRADFRVMDQILIEIKAIKKLGDIETAQALNYLKGTGLPLILLLNFGSSQLDWIRLVHTH
ncbi:MAG: GxxExxY protein [Acidobacteriota bacterium]|nr:GxxExxY protein [Acidobacteriota bacterium]